MTYPIRSQSQALEALDARQAAAGRPSRALVRQTDKAAEIGVVAGARIQAAGYAAHVGMVSLAMISAEANHLANTTPGLDPVQKARTAERLNHLADAYAGVVASEISRLGW